MPASNIARSLSVQLKYLLAGSLEKAMSQSAKVQPFVEDAVVRIDKEQISKKQGVYKYITLTGDMLNVTIRIKYGDEQVTAKLRYIPEMDYPLMYIEE